MLNHKQQRYSHGYLKYVSYRVMYLIGSYINVLHFIFGSDAFRQFHSKESKHSLCFSFQFDHCHLHYYTRSLMIAFVCAERFRLTKCPRFFMEGNFFVEPFTCVPLHVRISVQQPFYSTLNNNFL